MQAVEDYGEFELSDGSVVVLKKNSLVSRFLTNFNNEENLN